MVWFKFISLHLLPVLPYIDQLFIRSATHSIPRTLIGNCTCHKQQQQHEMQQAKEACQNKNKSNEWAPVAQSIILNSHLLIAVLWVLKR